MRKDLEREPPFSLHKEKGGSLSNSLSPKRKNAGKIGVNP